MKDFTAIAKRIAASLSGLRTCGDDPDDPSMPLAIIIKGKHDADRIDRLIAEGGGRK